MTSLAALGGLGTLGACIWALVLLVQRNRARAEAHDRLITLAAVRLELGAERTRRAEDHRRHEAELAERDLEDRYTEEDLRACSGVPGVVRERLARRLSRAAGRAVTVGAAVSVEPAASGRADGPGGSG